MASDLTWGVVKVAKLLDITPARLGQLVSEGVIPKAGRGRYAPFAANIAYIRFLRDRAKAPDMSDSEFHQAKLNKVRSEREQIELEMQIKRGERVPKEDVDAACRMVFRQVCSILKANRNKTLTEAQINEIFSQFRDVSKQFRNDNGSVQLPETD